jgi:hypothetical protein
MKSIAELLDQAALLPVNSPARRDLEIKVLEETGITNMKYDTRRSPRRLSRTRKWLFLRR